MHLSGGGQLQQDWRVTVNDWVDGLVAKQIELFGEGKICLNLIVCVHVNRMWGWSLNSVFGLELPSSQTWQLFLGAVSGLRFWSCNVLFSLAADWIGESETSVVIDRFLMKSISMIMQCCSNINGNASQILIEKDAFYVDYVIPSNWKSQVRWIFIFFLISDWVALWERRCPC